jgi:hypothetical protein
MVAIFKEDISEQQVRNCWFWNLSISWKLRLYSFLMSKFAKFQGDSPRDSPQFSFYNFLGETPLTLPEKQRQTSVPPTLVLAVPPMIPVESLRGLPFYFWKIFVGSNWFDSSLLIRAC